MKGKDLRAKNPAELNEELLKLRREQTALAPINPLDEA